MNTIRWGLLAAGAIARAFAHGVRQSQTGRLHAVASRNRDKAETFGDAFDIPHRYGSYEELLADPQVDAVYISTPHPFHAMWAIRAAEAGKHLVVEKPLGINRYEAQAMMEAARAHRVFLMEGYMYRCHPQTRRLVELFQQGVVGQVGVIQACFSFPSSFSADSRLWRNDLAGGGILDVGGYAVSMARLLAGAALGMPFAEPTAVSGAGSLHPDTGVDAWAVASLQFASGITASLGTGIALNRDNTLHVFGTEGHLWVPDPWQASRTEAHHGRIFVQRHGSQTPEEIVVESTVTSFAHEADVAGRAILDGQLEAPAPATTWEDTLGNLRVQDAWRASIGLIYKAEQPEGYTHTIARRPLTVKADPVTGSIAHLDKPVSRLVMGVDNQFTMPHAATIFDDYIERGGNAFDTAWVYGPVLNRLFGQWMRNRGIREQIVVIAKGAHTPLCNPQAVTDQLFEQFDWLGTDHADLYLLHRDNPDIPVGEFVDVLNEHLRAGRIRAFGGSNWSLDRVLKANAYARRKGLQGFDVISNNLALAEMVAPIWHGSIHIHGADDRRRLRRSGLALLAWSSQARGFFASGRAHPDRRDDPELVRCWYSPENFVRLDRARELAEQHGVEPINIALAWVLAQPFPVFALIGPRTLAETRSTWRVLDVKLSPKEVAYLNLEDDRRRQEVAP